MSTDPDNDLPTLVRHLAARHKDDLGPLLPILHDLREETGHIPPAAVPLLAKELNLSRAEVHGVVTFYRDFREAAGTEAAGTAVQVCRGEACQAVGAEALAAHARARLGDGVADVFCLGNCALGPSVHVGGMTHGLVDEGRLEELITRASEAVTR